MKQVHLIIAGGVQGVFFRDHTRGIARKLGLKGWVRNLDNDKVSKLDKSSADAIEKLNKIELSQTAFEESEK